MKITKYILVELLIVTTFTIYGQSEEDENTKQNEMAVVESVANATVYIETSNNFLGSGFFITNDGFILTNYHVIEGADKAFIETRNGKKYKVEYVSAYSPKLDLALLKITGEGFPYLSLADPKEIDLNDEIIIVGHPHGLKWTLTKGYIAGKRIDRGRPVVQFSADISPGNSGGPVVLEDGRVCGIATYLLRKKIRFSDGSVIIDPSSVLKFGVSVDAFKNSIENPHALPKTTLKSLADGANKLKTLNYLAAILEITHEHYLHLNKGLRDLDFETIDYVDPTHRTISGRSKTVFTETTIYNADGFFDATARLEAMVAFHEKYLNEKTGYRELDEAVDFWKNSVRSAYSSINTLEKANTNNAVNAANTSKNQYNESMSLMYKALLNVEKLLKSHGEHIIEPWYDQQIISDLIELYKAGKMKF
jgi:hypothetical protein